MPNTLHGYPYPAGVDALTDYPALAQLLAEKLEGQHQPIFDSRLIAAAASVDITSIPQTFAHLRLRVEAQSTGAAAYLNLRFNNDSANNYYANLAGGNATPVFVGTSVAAASSMRAGYCAATARGATSLAATVLDLLDYRDTVRRKIVLGKTHEDTSSVLTIGGSWIKAPEAINRITVFPDVGNFAIGTRVTLEGIPV